MASRTVMLQILSRFQAMREAAGVSGEELERRLILGPGWVSRFESGKTIPSLDLLLAMVSAVGGEVKDLFVDLDVTTSPADVDRFLYAEDEGSHIEIHFRYAAHDAVYQLPNANLGEFQLVIQVLRDGLARPLCANKSETRFVGM